MRRSKFMGTGVALVTPFTSNQEIDFIGLGNLLKYTWAEKKGVDYWVVQGTTGESATLTKKEKQEVLSYVLQNNPQKLPVVYGIGGYNTKEVLQTIQDTDLEGIDAILSVSPYYNKPSQEGIYQHFCAIADKSPVPVILYNVPGRTASNITAQTTLRLATHPNIIGIKEASGNLVQCMEIVQAKPQDFLLLSGDDLLAVPMIAIGAEGVISVLANAFPKIFCTMINAALEQKMLVAQENLYKLLAINPHMYEESNPVGIKYALTLLDVCSNQVRLPLVVASDSLEQKIKAAMPLVVNVN